MTESDGDDAISPVGPTHPGTKPPLRQGDAVALPAGTRRHTCMQRECTAAPRNDAGFLCPEHWFALPTDLRDRIWNAYRARDRARSLALVTEAMRYLRDTP